MTSLTRRYHFAASHRLHSPLLSEAENRRLYGKCNNPFGHGHDYVLAITVSGPIDPDTGLILPMARLDEFVSQTILRLFAHRNINSDVPEFASLVPTTENLACVIGGLVRSHWREFFADLKIWPSRIHIQETDRNGFELKLAAPEKTKRSVEQNESVMIHA
jgi:6-pyruvoyltetrahydropterin/6-carboxytetrahydropterin synthase